MSTIAAYGLITTLAGLLSSIIATLYFDSKKSLLAFNISRAALIIASLGVFVMATSLVLK